MGWDFDITVLFSAMIRAVTTPVIDRVQKRAEFELILCGTITTATTTTTTTTPPTTGQK